MLDTNTIALIAALGGPGATILCSYFYEEIKARRARNVAATSSQVTSAKDEQARQDDRLARAVEIAIKAQSDINAALERRDAARNEDFDQMRDFYHDQVEALEREIGAKDKEIAVLRTRLDRRQQSRDTLTNGET